MHPPRPGIQLWCGTYVFRATNHRSYPPNSDAGHLLHLVILDACIQATAYKPSIYYLPVHVDVWCRATSLTTDTRPCVPGVFCRFVLSGVVTE